MARISEVHPIAKIASLAVLAASVACAGAPPASLAADDARDEIRAEEPGAVFPSVQAAALDALAAAHRTATARDRQRLRVGTIHRVAHGFAYSAPQRAVGSSLLMRQRVRHRLRPIDVASYVIPPRWAECPSARLSETPDRKMQRIVDELDPAHRPVYVLTQSLDVMSYSRGGQTRVVTTLSARK
jgi:hypothetical protein